MVIQLLATALLIRVGNHRRALQKIIALQRAGGRNPMTHENAEDLTANVLVGRSVRHRSTIRLAPSLLWPHGNSGQDSATEEQILAFAACPLLGATRTWSRHHFGASHHASRVLPERLRPYTGRTFKYTSLKCGPGATTRTSHIGSRHEGQRGRSATNTIEVKTK